MRSIVNNEGFFALYKGFSASMFGIIHPLVFFPLYEKLKIYLLKNHEPPGTEKLSNPNILLCSSISKTLASTISYPHEIFRARMYYERKEVYLYSLVKKSI